jgi:hypothetical protein
MAAGTPEKRHAECPNIRVFMMRRWLGFGLNSPQDKYFPLLWTLVLAIVLTSHCTISMSRDVKSRQFTKCGSL